MTEKHNIGGSLPIEVVYWGQNVLSGGVVSMGSDANKVKIVDTHPVRPLILSVDGEGRVIVTDFNTGSVIMNMPVSDILNNISSTTTVSLTNRSTSELFIKQRMSLRGSGCVRSDKFCGHIKSSAPSATNSLNIRPKGNMLNIHQLSFVDSATVHVVVYDYCTRMGFTVTEAELSKSPVCAEFLGPDFLAIGCADGAVRVFDTRIRVVVKTLGGHSKGPVGVLKTVPLVGGNCSSASVDGATTRVRLVSFGVDGAVLIWDLCLSVTEGGTVVDIENSTSNGLPTARLKESLGVIAGGLSRGNVQYDAETNSLLICTGDRRIKIWDLGEVRQAQAQQKAQSIQQAKTAAAKRQSVLLSVVGGSGRDGHYADIFGISCVATVKPGDKRDRRIEVASFAALNSPLFPADSFILCSKTNSVGIYKSRESHAGDDKSERSSVAASSTEKSQRLQLLQEFSLTSLMERFVATHSLSEGARDAARSSVLKVYSLKVHAAQPHMVVLATSVGVVVLALQALPSGALSGCHPCWGPTKLFFANNSVRKIVLDSPVSSSLDRSASRASMSDLFGGGPSFCEVSVEITSEFPLGAEIGGGTELGGRPGSVLGGKRMSFNPSNAKRLGSVPASSETLTSKPSFHPSPSGAYCALLWWDTMLYLVLRVGDTPLVVPSSSSGRNEISMVEVDRGYCTSFGWVGSHDCYLVKTPPHIAPIAAPKTKRSSIMGGIFGGEKESKKLFRSELLLFQCAAGETHVRRLDLETQPFFNGVDCTVVNIHSGPLVHLNLMATVEQARKTPVVASGEAVVAGSAHVDLTSVAEGDGMVLDVDKTERELLSGGVLPRSSLLSRFYCLLTTAEARRLEALSFSSKTDGKKQKKTKSNKEGGEEVVAEVQRTDEHNNVLWAIGPVMSAVDAVRWDHCSGRCAVLMGQETINILQLTTDSTGNGSVTLVTLTTLSLSPPVSLFQNITGLLWDRHWLLAATSSSGRLVFDCRTLSLPDGDVETHTVLKSPVAHHVDTETGGMNCYLPWTEVLGIHYGNLYSCNRDGTLRVSSLNNAPLLCVDSCTTDTVEWTQRMSGGDQEAAVSLLQE